MTVISDHDPPRSTNFPHSIPFISASLSSSCDIREMTVSLNAISRYIRRCTAATKILDLKFSKISHSEVFQLENALFLCTVKRAVYRSSVIYSARLYIIRPELCKSAKSEYIL